MKNIENMMENLDQTINLLDKNSEDEINLLDTTTDADADWDPNIVEQTNFIKCGSNTDPNSLAYYIAMEFQKTKYVVIQTIGPRALSKAILSIVKLKSIVAPYIDGHTLVSRFSVRKLQLPNGEERTAIRTRLFSVPDEFSV